MITVGISTRDRFESLVRCVESIRLISDLVEEVIVVDDCSNVPVEPELRQRLGQNFPVRLRVVRHDVNYGPIVARNTLAQIASQEFLLSLDDDAVLLERQGILTGLKLLSSDKSIGAIAFAQANESGEPWPKLAQPGPVDYRCYVSAYIGFAVLIRRDTFLSLGGYRSLFYYYGEEKEYCLRMLEAGVRVVYLPEALVAHIPDPSGRSAQKYLRYVIRNDCLGAIYNHPFPLVLGYVASRFYAYFSMKRNMKLEDPGGFAWIVKELFSNFPRLRKERVPLSWSTFRKWKQIRTVWPPYQSAPESS
ncbi:MAG TPA: glycosyltransferase [Pyrinomonadaceae bacterium]|nr:glycosyltransferase [Pyrinomonadaceae bacterium]